MTFLTLLLCFGCVVIGGALGKLNVYHQWKYIDFVWNDPLHKSTAIDSGDYKNTSCFPFDTDRAPDGRIFVTLVRDEGVPATLTTVSDKKGEGGPLLKPYPDWSWNERTDCEGIIGVYRVSVVGNRIYVLDTGKKGETQVCPAQLLIFNLRNDKLVRRVRIPSQYATNANGTGLLVTPAVSVFGPRRDKIIVYMADTEGYGLVLWDGKGFQRLESKSFEADSSSTHFTIGEDSFDLADGILGMAITVDERDVFKQELFYRPLASPYMYHAKLSQLRHDRSGIRYTQEPEKLRSQSAAQAFSRNGILFFNSLSDFSLICWNRHKTFNTENTVPFATDPTVLQFPSGLKVVPLGREDLLLVMTNRYQKIANSKIDFSDVNFRISGGVVRDLVRGTRCE